MNLHNFANLTSRFIRNFVLRGNNGDLEHSLSWLFNTSQSIIAATMGCHKYCQDFQQLTFTSEVDVARYKASVVLRMSFDICSPHRCICRDFFDKSGIHGLGCSDICFRNPWSLVRRSGQHHFFVAFTNCSMHRRIKVEAVPRSKNQHNYPKNC